MGVLCDLPPLFPMDATLPVRERRFISIGILVIHVLAIAWLLKAAGHGVSGGGNQIQGNASALSVTFITPLPSRQPVLAIPTHALTPVERDPANGADAQTTQVKQTTTKTLQVPADVGDRMSKANALQTPSQTIKKTAAATSAFLATEGGSPGNDRLASYHAALRATIRRKWMELTSRPFPSSCTLQLNLAVGGAVNVTSAASCKLEEADRLQLEAAALMAQPLPYAGYEDVFTTDLHLVL